MIKINIGSPILSSSKLEKNLMQKKEKKIIPIILQNKKLIKYCKLFIPIQLAIY